MGRTTITRRRVLALGTAAGLGSLLARTPVPALARRGSSPRGFGLDVAARDFDAAGVSRVLRPSRGFDLLGVREVSRGGGRVEVRARRRGGRWSAWTALTAHGDHAPDTGSGERASDPIWFGPSDELQLRLRGRSAGPLRVHLVAVPPAARTARRGTARIAQVDAAAGTAPPIIPRAAWGGDGVKPRGNPAYGTVQMAFIHHTVSPNDYPPEQSASIVLGIAKYHRDTNGWNDIGYNFLVDQYGQVFEGRAGGVDQAVIGAQAQGYNSSSTGIAHLGTQSAVPIGEPAMKAIAQLLGWKLPLHGVPTEGQLVLVSGGGDVNRYRAGTEVTFERVSGHRDGDATSCPGDALYAQLPELRRRATAVSGPIQRQGGGLTLASAEEAILYGDDAVFTGTLVRGDGSIGAGEAVRVQKRGSAGGWVTIGTATAAADGGWSVRVPWRRAGAVRALAAGLTSPVRDVALVPRLSARAASKRVLAGHSVRLSGRVRPASSVKIVIARAGSDGRYRWVRSVKGSVRKDRWGATVRLTKPGLYRLTTRTAKGEAVAPAVYVRAVRSAAHTGGASTSR